MRIGTTLVLIAVGLVLRYAVSFEIPGLDVAALGSILFFVGLLGLGVAVYVETVGRRALDPRAPRAPRVPRRDAQAQPAPRTPVHHPVVGSDELDDAELADVMRRAGQEGRPPTS